LTLKIIELQYLLL